MAGKTFEQAKSELIECAVGFNEYEDITTWEELAEGAALERSAADDRVSRLQSLLTQAEEEADKE